jgi:DNA invertase Pin-like site-specific DNA recombinase
MPNADKFQLHIYAALAEQEREFIGARTKAGLAAAKAQGKRLGGIRPNTITRNDSAKAKAIDGAEQLRPLLVALKAQGASLREMAQTLAAAGTTTAKGNPLSPTQIKRHLGSLGLLAG